MTKKRKILIFNRCYIPGYKAGGPIRSIANLVDRLADEFDFYIITRDRDSGDSGPYDTIAKEEWNQQGSARVFYIPPNKISLMAIIRLIRVVEPDVIYLNSFFDPWFTQKVLASRRLGLFGNIRVVLAPRGEFSRGALELKATKKWWFLKIVQFVGLYRGVVWQASTVREAEEIREGFPSSYVNQMIIARNIAPVVLDKFNHTKQMQKDNCGKILRVCFLSRISPIKNLRYNQIWCLNS